MDCQRSFRQKIIFVISFVLAGCTTFVGYQGEELPDEEIATFKCSWRFLGPLRETCGFWAIDGNLAKTVPQVLAGTAKILPGKRPITLNFINISGRVDHLCSFEMDLKAGHTYLVEVFSLKTARSAWFNSSTAPYGGTIDLEIKAPSGEREVRNIAMTCRPPYF